MDEEVNIAAAVQSFLNGEFSSMQDAADAYNVDVSKIMEILNGN